MRRGRPPKRPLTVDQAQLAIDVLERRIRVDHGGIRAAAKAVSAVRGEDVSPRWLADALEDLVRRGVVPAPRRPASWRVPPPRLPARR